MIAILAAILAVVITLIPGNAGQVEAECVRPQAPSDIDSDDMGDDWSEYHAEAMQEYADEFTALFNSYETKRAKNGAMMIRTGNVGSYKFARKGL